MDIAAMASILKQGQLQQSVALSVVKLAMDQGEGQAQDLVKMMESSVNPNLGQSIDIRL